MNRMTIFSIIAFFYGLVIFLTLKDSLMSKDIVFQILLVLGGSAALCFHGLAKTPLDKEICLFSFFISSCSCSFVTNDSYWYISIFWFTLLYLMRIFLPLNFVLWILLCIRGFFFKESLALIVQILSFFFWKRHSLQEKTILFHIFLSYLR